MAKAGASSAAKRLAELQADHAALTARYLADTAPAAEARRRLETVLAPLVAAAGRDAGRRPPSSIGQRLGALVDVAVYGGAGLLGIRRATARERVRLALTDHWPGLWRRLRPDAQAATAPPVAAWPPRNVFADRSARETLARLVAEVLAGTRAHGPVRTLIALNFHAGGGAETIAAATARVAAQAGGLVVILQTDTGPRTSIPDLPANVLVLDLAPTALDPEMRQTIVWHLWQASAPAVFHIVNSDAAWRMLRACPPALTPPGRRIASLFALQFDAAGRPEGFAAQHLPEGGPRLDRLLTDNRRFADEGAARVGAVLTPFQTRVVPSPCRLEGVVDALDAASRLAARTRPAGERMTVVWAGRLDAEKRIDLLAEIAEAMQGRCDFHVYGRPVLAAPDEAVARLAALPNVTLMGAYDSPLIWDEGFVLPNAFLFTSRWEGMPNTIIEAAWMGLPIVATDVGGISDLVDPTTGWPIPADAPASAYVAALEALHADPAAARDRTARLIARTHARHTRAAFEAGLKAAWSA